MRSLVPESTRFTGTAFGRRGLLPVLLDASQPALTGIWRRQDRCEPLEISERLEQQQQHRMGGANCATMFVLRARLRS